MNVRNVLPDGIGSREERPGLGPARQLVLRGDRRDVEVERDLVVAHVDEVAEELLLVDAPDRLVVAAVGPLQGLGAEGAFRSADRERRRYARRRARTRFDLGSITSRSFFPGSLIHLDRGKGTSAPRHSEDFARPVKANPM